MTEPTPNANPKLASGKYGQKGMKANPAPDAPVAPPPPSDATRRGCCDVCGRADTPIRTYRADDTFDVCVPCDDGLRHAWDRMTTDERQAVLRDVEEADRVGR